MEGWESWPGRRRSAASERRRGRAGGSGGGSIIRSRRARASSTPPHLIPHRLSTHIDTTPLALSRSPLRICPTLFSSPPPPLPTLRKEKKQTEVESSAKRWPCSLLSAGRGERVTESRDDVGGRPPTPFCGWLGAARARARAAEEQLLSSKFLLPREKSPPARPRPSCVQLRPLLRPARCSPDPSPPSAPPTHPPRCTTAPCARPRRPSAPPWCPLLLLVAPAWSWSRPPPPPRPCASAPAAAREFSLVPHWSRAHHPS
jgi:hypothetical protein